MRNRKHDILDWVEGIFSGVVLVSMVGTLYYIYLSLNALGF